MRPGSSHRARKLLSLIVTTSLAVVPGSYLLAQDTITPSKQGNTGQQPPDVLPPSVVESPRTQGTVAPALPFPGAPTPGTAAGGTFSSAPTTGYKADSATTGSKLDLPNLDFPGTVDTVPQATIQDQSNLRTEDFLRNIPSAIYNGDPRRPDSFIVRGFEVRARDFRRDGFLDPSPEPRDLANIDRIELLKGPASVLYGGGQPSGVLNFITKKPVNDSFIQVDSTYGSFDLFRETIDANTQVLGNDHLLFRLNAAYEHSNGWRDFGFSERTVVAPALTWIVNHDTQLTFLFEHIEDRRRFDSGVVAINGAVGAVPIRNYLDQPGDFFRHDVDRFTMILDHRLNECWSLRVGGFIGMHDSNADATVPTVAATDISPFFPPTLFFRQRQFIPDFSEQTYSVVADLAGNVQTGSIKHKLLIGNEFIRFDSTNFSSFFSNIFDPATFAPVSPIDAVSPQFFYGLPQPTSLPGSYSADYIQTRDGTYAQDVIEVNPWLKFLGGVRYDWAQTTFDRHFTPSFPPPPGAPFGYPETRSEATNFRLTPKAGVILEPVPEQLSVYYTYSQSFDPPPGGIYGNLEPLRPETGQMHEAGVKANIFDKKLNLFAAAFFIEKNNVVVENANTLFAMQVGKQRSQGVETGAVGNITDRWSIIANYAYVDARVQEDDNPAIIGNRLRNAAYNNANIWTRYNLIQNDCQVFGLGAGWVYVGNRPGDVENSFFLPGYSRFDAGVFYQRDRWHLGVYFENVFDRQYYAGSANALSVFPGAPFNVRGTLGVRF